MGAPAEPNLIKVTEIFLIPSSFLVAALGTADTNLHRAFVSLLGLIISFMWWLCSSEAYGEIKSHHMEFEATREPRRVRAMCRLAPIFGAGWLFSLNAHLYLWNRPLGG
jgi:hypothetical protein